MSESTTMPYTPVERYIQLDSALSLADREMSSSEVHGTIIGCISNHLATGVKPDLITLLAGNDQPQDRSALLELIYEIYRENSELLFNSDDTFDLFMPDDDETLAARTDALAQWCQGYLLGLLHGDQLTIDQLPEDGAEIARDIMSISQAGPSEGDEAQQDEWALAELEEYVKVGVQLIFEFIYQSRATKQPSVPEQ